MQITPKCYSNCLLVDGTCALNVSMKAKLLDKQTRTRDSTNQGWNTSVAWVSIDTEAGMLSGISRKRSIRSNPYWFTEFCNSQCLSHFAAPFIVVRAETSVAESCMKHAGGHPPKMKDRSEHKNIVQTDTVARQ